jgi:hypothetical protein
VFGFAIICDFSGAREARTLSAWGNSVKYGRSQASINDGSLLQHVRPSSRHDHIDRRVDTQPGACMTAARIRPGALSPYSLSTNRTAPLYRQYRPIFGRHREATIHRIGIFSRISRDYTPYSCGADSNISNYCHKSEILT